MHRNRGGRLDKAFLDVSQREVGGLTPRNFALRFAGSKDLVSGFRIDKRLQQHSGCVNSVNFNQEGDILLSGSDDRHAILWDWQAGKVKFSFHTGHRNNVFQAKFMPYTNSQTIVTSAADGQVRHAHILDGGMLHTTLLTKHRGRVHKLAIQPGNPYIFYTCGEDGSVQHLDLRDKRARELFTCRRPGPWLRVGIIVQLNTIAIDPRNQNILAVAGSDEYARLYDMRKYRWDESSNFGQPADCFCPPHLTNSTEVGITGLAFSNQSELLVSYYNECIYLFDRKMGLGTVPLAAHSKSTTSKKTQSVVSVDADEALDVPQMYVGHRNYETVKGVGFFGPKCEYVVSGSDCGCVFIWKRDGQILRAMEADKSIVNCIESHPHTAVLASSGIESDIKVWTPDASEKDTLSPISEMVLPHDASSGLSYLPWDGSSDEDEDEEFYDEQSFSLDEDDEDVDNDDDDDDDISSDDEENDANDDDANDDDDLDHHDFDGDDDREVTGKRRRDAEHDQEHSDDSASPRDL